MGAKAFRVPGVAAPSPHTHLARKPAWRQIHRGPAPPPPRRLRPRPAADVSCYVSARAAAPADPPLPRRVPRPREVAGASGTAAETRAAHLSGAGAAWPGSRPRAAQGTVWGLFLLFFRTVGPRAPYISAETATPPPGTDRGAGPPKKRRPPARANLEPPPPCPPRLSRSLGGRRGLGPGRRARRCGGRSSPSWARGLAEPSAAPS